MKRSEIRRRLSLISAQTSTLVTKLLGIDLATWANTPVLELDDVMAELDQIIDRLSALRAELERDDVS